MVHRKGFNMMKPAHHLKVGDKLYHSVCLDCLANFNWFAHICPSCKSNNVRAEETGTALPADVRSVKEDQSNLQEILLDRGKRYGSFTDNSQIAQSIKNVLKTSRFWNDLHSDQKEALDQIASKVSRILTGDPTYIDNWDDIAGYATLVADELRRQENERQREEAH